MSSVLTNRAEEDTVIVTKRIEPEPEEEGEGESPGPTLMVYDGG